MILDIEKCYYLRAVDQLGEIRIILYVENYEKEPSGMHTNRIVWCSVSALIGRTYKFSSEVHWDYETLHKLDDSVSSMTSVEAYEHVRQLYPEEFI